MLFSIIVTCLYDGTTPNENGKFFRTSPYLKQKLRNVLKIGRQEDTIQLVMTRIILGNNHYINNCLDVSILVGNIICFVL